MKGFRVNNWIFFWLPMIIVVFFFLLFVFVLELSVNATSIFSLFFMLMIYLYSLMGPLEIIFGRKFIKLVNPLAFWSSTTTISYKNIKGVEILESSLVTKLTVTLFLSRRRKKKFNISPKFKSDLIELMRLNGIQVKNRFV